MDAGLYFSIVLRPRLEIKAWPLITLMAALAVADALKEACALDVDIKWPNDILVGERKLCGILAETVETQIGRAAIVGIGINLQESAVPPELHERAIAIESVTGTVPDGEAVLRALVRAIGCRYARLLADDGPQVTLRAWAEHSSYATGKRVTVALGSETLTGITRGLEKDGALRVETAAGEIKVVHAGDVTALRVTGNS
jgi:BirA family biotin operon repressor/biotin-[acetyl-CoA-carboxylase] ligase